jgi:hypothetical protein
MICLVLRFVKKALTFSARSMIFLSVEELFINEPHKTALSYNLGDETQNTIYFVESETSITTNTIYY